MNKKSRKRKIHNRIFRCFTVIIALISVIAGLIWIWKINGDDNVNLSNGQLASPENFDEGIDQVEVEEAIVLDDSTEDLNTLEDVENETETVSENTPTKEELLEERANYLLSNMSIEEKIYQMIIVTPEELTGVSDVAAAGETTRQCLEKYPVGGVVYFSSNLKSPSQTKEMLANIQEYSNSIENLPLFLCVDEEGGSITRVAQNPSFGVTNVGNMKSIDSSEKAYECGELIGEYLYDLGFNVNFAPDVDVLSNSANQVIGDRSFGANPEIVTEYGMAYSDGLHKNYIMSTFKHYPGHGATEGDTHQGYAYTNKTYEELLGNELMPFSRAQEYGVDFVMVAHISLPNVIGDDTPCSLSYKMVTEVLRNELGYNGIVITDAMDMEAISEQYSTRESAVLAVEAGVDMLLMPSNLVEAYDSLFSAFESGRLSEERIDRSVYRIILTKLRYEESCGH